MPTESATIIIDADDRASRKIAQAAANAERAVKQIKDVGQKAKSSTEFFGQLANVMGGGVLSQYAGQLGQLTEKISQFSEVSKAGAAGALAFKGGLVALTAIVSFKIGESIGNAIFQTKKWREELAKAADEAKRLDIEIARVMRREFQLSKEEVSVISDPAKQRTELAKLLRDIEKQIDDTRKQIVAKSNREETLYEAWMLTPNDRKALVDTSAEQSRLEVLREQRNELQDQLSVRRQMIEQAKADAEAAKQAEQLRQKAIDDAANKKEHAIDLLKKETDRITEQRIELEKGKEAAHAFALEMQGLAKADAERIARDQAEIDALREKKALKDLSRRTGDTTLEAFESRLLTRGPVANKELEVANKQLDELKKIRDKLPLHSTPSQRLQLEVVG